MFAICAGESVGATSAIVGTRALERGVEAGAQVAGPGAHALGGDASAGTSASARASSCT